MDLQLRQSFWWETIFVFPECRCLSPLVRWRRQQGSTRPGGKCWLQSGVGFPGADASSDGLVLVPGNQSLHPTAERSPFSLLLPAGLSCFWLTRDIWPRGGYYEKHITIVCVKARSGPSSDKVKLGHMTSNKYWLLKMAWSTMTIFCFIYTTIVEWSIKGC